MASGSKKNWFWLIGGATFLLLGGLAIAPHLLGSKRKTTVVVPPPAPPSTTGDIISAINTPPGYDYGVANSQYGRLRGYNFAGLALEQPTNVMPLGFHLNNVL